MNLIKNKWMAGLILLIITMAAFLIFLNIKRKSYEFYYPDEDLKIMKSEQRLIEIHKKYQEIFEEELIREYLLGPERYDLKLPLDNNVRLKNVWIITKWKSKAIVINFNGDFSGFVQSNKDSSEWFIKGLVDTVRECTLADKLIICVEDQPFREKIDNWNLTAIPLRIKK
jgi:hypothetical protein